MPTLKLDEQPTPPKHLRKETKQWFVSVTQDYQLEDHHVRLLTLACESWDRAMQAREALAVHGLTYDDKYGCPHPRPEVGIERGAMITFMRAVRELDLNVGNPTEPPRPPGLRSNRRV